MVRWLTAGESHGPALVTIAEGLPVDGRVVRSIAGIAPDGMLQALLADGEADLRVLALRPRAPPGRG